ncbi:sensor histidine kinase [Pleionea sediminis]|uniref:sensor histidine kinase n=1 Tax=Pleionea sediminis TaxID=2569479 RepID=UPI0013DE333E|nr:ATP-binding protein [Pleionea sediminis]
MTLKIKLTLIALGIAIITSAITWLNGQNTAAAIKNTHESIKIDESNQIQNQARSFFNQFLSASRAIDQQANFIAQLGEFGNKDLVGLLNATSSKLYEFAVYSADDSTLYRFNKPSQANKYYGLENTILNQIKSPSLRTAIHNYQGEHALIQSSGIVKEELVSGVILSILPLNQTLVDYLAQLTGADFKLSIGNKSYVSNSGIDFSKGEVIELPIKTNVNVSILFVNSLKTDKLIEEDTSYIGTYAIIGMMVGLILLVFFISQSYTNQVQSMAKASEDAENALQLAAALKNLTLNTELNNLVQNITGLITEQNNQNRQLQNKAKQLEHSLKDLKSEKKALLDERDSAVKAPKTKSEFLSRMGDEITTPMKTLSNMLHLLSEYKLDDEPKELLNISRRSANTLINNLNNILDFSKLDAGLLKLYKDNFEVKKLLEDIVKEYSPHADAKTLILTSKISHNVPDTIYNDPKRVKQILKNLLGNAIRFTKDGEVCLLCDLVTEEEGQEHLRFAVKDSGVGIPEEAQKGLFDSLEQRTKLTNSSFAGRLRLIVSKKLSELMGGTIGVVSEQQKGSEFWFTIQTKK